MRGEARSLVYKELLQIFSFEFSHILEAELRKESILPRAVISHSNAVSRIKCKQSYQVPKDKESHELSAFRRQTGGRRRFLSRRKSPEVAVVLSTEQLFVKREAPRPGAV